MLLVQKWPFFQLFYLVNIGQEKVFYDILERKNVFLGYKNKKIEKVEKLTFFHFSHAFGPKMAIFPSFFLVNIGQENLFLRYSKTKKRLFRL